ncbi:MAG: archaetidylinositol phosphate synthase [Infirmifilum sp.]|uniref:archaetidylinositol phosphate synthase n=1 Tax=Infirmifilum TaxID=2856573 RepID=UPI003C723448
MKGDEESMLNRIRAKLHVYLRYIAAPLVYLRIDPNLITLTGLLFGFLSVLAYAHYPLMILFFILMILSDAIDGQVARAIGKVTKFGAFLDSTIDRVEDALSYYLLYLLRIVGVEELLIAMIGAFLVSYTRSRAESLGVEMMGIGVAERAERLILTFLALITAPLSLTVARIIFAGLLVLTYLTVLQRVLHVYKMLGDA